MATATHLDLSVVKVSADSQMQRLHCGRQRMEIVAQQALE